MTSTAVPPRKNALSLSMSKPGRNPTGLPATGMQQQIMSLQQRQQGLITPGQGQAAGQGQLPGQGQGQGQGQPPSRVVRPGQTNLNDIATNLARNYGIQLGATPLVDEQGNFQRMPTSGQEAVGFQFISQAITDELNRRQQKKAESSLQQGVGMLQSRGRGSLAAVQSGQFEALANLYSQQQFRAADFSYFVQKEQLDRQEALMARQERMMKKAGKKKMFGSIVGGVLGFVVGGPAGAMVGSQLGGAVAGGGGGSTGFF